MSCTQEGALQMTEEEKKAKEEEEKKAKEEAEKKAEEEEEDKLKNLDPDIIALIEAKAKKNAEELLKPIKEKLNGAYSQRDEALKALEDKKQAEKEAEIERLKNDGKEKEAAELELAEERAKRKALEEANLRLTRDAQITNALSVLDFKNEKARTMAFNEIRDDLVKDANGVWTHRSGVSITDFIKSYASNEGNSFLFKPVVSSGAGSSRHTSGNSDDDRPLSKMTQKEVLQAAREGRLPHQRK